jgi:hypothetical protein
MGVADLHEAPGVVSLHGWQHQRDNMVGRRVRVCLRGCRKPELRVPIYKPGTFLLVWELDSIKPLCRIRG